MAGRNALHPTSTFSNTITFVAEMIAGGADADARTNQYQRWHCLISGESDTSIDTSRLDNVVDTFFKTQITFFERASYRYPTPGSVALVSGKFFFAEGNAEPEIRVRAEPIRVYVYYCYSFASALLNFIDSRNPRTLTTSLSYFLQLST